MSVFGKQKQETVRGITFDPASLSLLLAGTSLEGEPIEECIKPVSPFKSYQEAVDFSETILRGSVTLYYVCIQTTATTISTVWGDE